MNTATTQWKETSLGEAVSIIDGDRGANYPNGDEFFTEGYCLFLNTKNVPNDKFVFDNKSFISEEKSHSLRKGKLQRGDYVLTTRGTIGNFAQYSAGIPYDHIRINSGMVILRPTEVVVNDFLRFYLLSDFFRSQIRLLQSGSVQPQLPIRDLETFLIILPPVPEQRKITEILGCFDQKIELLRKQNETLEEMAKAIFHEWFVEFNFPDRNGKPYKASGGKMVESGLGEIPEGWAVGTLAEMTEQLSARVGSDDQSNYTVMSAVNTGELIPSEEYFTKQVFSKSISKYIKLKQGDFAYNPARINIGSIGRLRPDVLGAVSPVYVAFRAKDKYGSFVDYLIQTARMKRHIELFANGSVRQTLGYDGLTAFSLALPDEDTLTAFEMFSIFTEKTLAQKKQQIAQLQEIRDTLLPKLMSGELRVNT